MHIETTVQRFSQKLLLLGAVAAIAALVYSIWHRWTGLVSGAEWKDMLLYYALPLLAVAATLAFAAWWPGIDKLFTLLIVGSVAIALVAADIYFQYLLYDEQGPTRAAAQRLNLPFDARNQAQVVADLRQRGLRADPFARIISDPNLVMLGIMPNVVAVVCNEFGPWFTPKTDRYGFANPDEIWSAGAPMDAVIIGDSFAMGECDPVTGGFASLLRKQGRRILNLGIGGNDPLLNLASLAEFGLMRKSRFIFWMHYAGNDLAGLNDNRKYPILRRYVEDSSFRQRLVDRMPEIETRLAALEERVERPRRSFLSSMLSAKGLPRSLRLYTLRSAFGLARNINEEADFALLERIFKRARGIADEMGGKLIVVNIPAPGQVSYDSAVEAKTADVAKSAGIDFIDLKTIFRKTGDYRALYSQGFKGHFSPAGNTLVAKVLSDIVAEETKR